MLTQSSGGCGCRPHAAAGADSASRTARPFSHSLQRRPALAAAFSPASLLALFLVQLLGCHNVAAASWSIVGRQSINAPNSATEPQLAFGPGGAVLWTTYRPQPGNSLAFQVLTDTPATWMRMPALQLPLPSWELFNPRAELSLAFRSDGTPVTAYFRRNGSSDANFFVYVQQYTRTTDQWGFLPTPNLGGAAVQNAVDHSLECGPDGFPVLAYRVLPGGAAALRRWNGFQWVAVGGSASKGVSALGLTLAISPSSGTPFIAFQGDGTLNGVKLFFQAVVMKFNAPTNSWEPVGGVKASPDQGAEPQLKISASGAVVLAYLDLSAGLGLTVQQLSGASWTVLGARGFVTKPSDKGLAFALAVAPNGAKFMAHAVRDVAQRLEVVRWDGSMWGTVCDGPAALSADGRQDVSLVLGPGSVPHVAYVDSSATGRLTVKRCT